MWFTHIFTIKHTQEEKIYFRILNVEFNLIEFHPWLEKQTEQQFCICRTIETSVPLTDVIWASFFLSHLYKSTQIKLDANIYKFL